MGRLPLVRAAGEMVRGVLDEYLRSRPAVQRACLSALSGDGAGPSAVAVGEAARLLERALADAGATRPVVGEVVDPSVSVDF
eukprot:1167318-Amphidinium_carterae.1